MTSSIKAFESLEPVKLSEFGDYFSSFRQEAFRLEALPLYSVPSEAEYFSKYLRGQSCPDDFNAAWLTLVSNATEQGKTITRVRYLPSEPTTSYLKFEIEWGYKRSVKKGERVLILKDRSLDTYADDVPVLNDFWLFDRAHCFIMYYDLLGRFLGVQKVRPEATMLYTNLSDRMKKNSIPID